MTGEAEVEELRRRLAEAEDTLRAIREGEVDALIVRGGEQDQVFHLGTGGDSYRAFMEAMELGAAAFNGKARLVYANAALNDLLGTEGDDLTGDGWVFALGPAASALRTLLSGSKEGKRSTQIVVGGDNRRRHVVVTAAPLPISFDEGVALTFTDITARVEAESAGESERVGRAVMAAAGEAVVVCDRDGIVTHANPAVGRLLGGSPVGRRFGAAFALGLAPGAGAMEGEDLVGIALAGSSVGGIEAVLRGSGAPRDLAIRATPLRQAGGAVGGCIVTLVDLTERKALEKRQALLMGELDHRMRNMLALVLSISTRTLRDASDLQDFGRSFTQRIAALAATQDILAARNGDDIRVEDIVSAELAPFVTPQGPRIRLSGLAVEVSRDTAVALGLVVHELVTNAVKYGSLSNETGRVVVEAVAGERGALDILWREEGGPAVSPPQRRGFGQSVISRGLGQASGTGAQIEFHPDGVICRMRLTQLET